ncbi:MULTISPECIES: metal ABC transporter ATP-binding protein [Leuconostoc]|uniref:Zinc/iron ABC transporter, ATP-binding protein n=2 Tax=Leuconostoc kimchii TaxID=136609 RepID=D5T4T6_LEUKI|nr:MULTISPECIES: ATP-binding cassette domain-containing protein [Leuconostoc]ADG41088.1 zinc/iron ABC transporter, ATP-binding protein [Leuconostoc kimchii IMSNU 11154]AEJ30940.1 zinc/iron ABC transporter, ATP-binding protein [Leuconostoc sp. C2]QBR48037.1 ATP-binding cassette domain-containing protein [Leuconostoc kimchii]
MGIIQTQDFGIRYGEKVILAHANIDVPEGRFFAVLGENGAGKTSFIKALIGQNQQINGQIQLNTTKVGFVPQFRDITRDYPLSIAEFVGLNYNQGWRLWLNKQERAAVFAALKRLDLSDMADKRLGLASGGQKQRAFVAQALVQQPDLLILDESTASLDHEHKVALLQTIKQLQRETQLTVLFITHELKLVSQFADGYLFFENGHVSQGEASELQSLTTQITNIHEEDEVRHV